MKKCIIHGFLMITMLFLFTRIQAQTMPTAEERSAKITEWMKTNLNLTPDQIQKVQEINLKYAKKTDDLVAGNYSKDDKKQIARTNNEAKEAELKNVFTEEQFTTYKAKKEELKKQVKEGMEDNED
jgi:hypothetical protein